MTTPRGRNSPPVGIGTFLLIVALALLFLLLAQRMVRHRFHEGGRFNRHGAIVP
jgi:hypothetical protein